MSTMKKLLLLLILLTAGLPGFSRIVDDEKGFTLGVGFGVWNETLHIASRKLHHIDWIGSARVGYRITPDVEAGIVLGRRDDRGSRYIVSTGVYGGYCFKRAGQFRVFADGEFADILSRNYYGGPKMDGIEFGIRPGVAYKLKNLPIDLKLRYLFLGFNNLSRVLRTEACLGGGNWIVDAGLNRLEIGAAVTF